MIQFELPVYKIKTPQTLVELHVESLTLAEENKLKASVTDKKGLMEILNRVIYDKIKDKPKELSTYEDFLNKITTKDREAIVAGLYHVSYGNEFVAENVCPYCGKVNTVKLNIENIGNITFYEGKKPFEFLELTWDIELPITKSKVSIKPSVLADEIKYFDILNETDPITGYLLFLHVSKIETKDGVVIDRNQNEYDVLSALLSLPVRDRKMLSKEITDKILKYSIELPYKVRCSNCNNEFISHINFLDQLFRMALE